MQNLKNQILEVIKDIKPGTVMHEMQLIAWPFSREFLKVILYKQDITDVKYHRMTKIHESFTFEANAETPAAIKKAFTLFNKFAKAENYGAKQKLKLVYDLRDAMGIQAFVEESAPVKEKALKQVVEKIKTEKPKSKVVNKVETKPSEPTCNCCGSKEVTKNGKDGKGLQKYKCKSCGSNFKC